GPEQLERDEPIEIAVVDHEDRRRRAQPRALPGPLAVAAPYALPHAPERKRELEQSLAGRRARIDLAAHEPCQIAGHREPEPRALRIARGAPRRRGGAFRAAAARGIV